MIISPRVSRHRFLPLTVVGVFLVVVVVTADEPKKDDTGKAEEKPAIAIVPTHAPGNAFGGGTGEFKFKIESKHASKGQVVWRLALGTATVQTGATEFSTAVGAPAAVTIGRGELPAVKDGVVVRTRLTVSVVEDKQRKPSAAHEQDVWLFPKDPFAGRSEWLKKLRITLYDPKGDTAKVLAAANVPFDEARGADAVGAVKDGVVIVGEGASFKDEKALGAALIKLAAAGRTVLILAPAAGEIPLPGIGGPSAEFSDLSFRRAIVRTLDKRLDPDGWLPDGKAVASSVVVKAGTDATVGEVAPGAAGWPWIDARVAAGKGRWALCGLGIIAKWEAGPTPRFFFARLLEHLTDSEPEQFKQDSER